MLHQRLLPTGCRLIRKSCWIPVIPQLGTYRAQMLLEGDQVGRIRLRTAEVKFDGAERFALLHCFPKKKGHSSQVMETRIRTSVLIDQLLPVGEREDAGNWGTILGDDADSKFVTHAGDQVPEPNQWLRRQLVPAAREQQQAVELGQERFGTPCLVCQSFTFRALDLPLDAVLVETAEHSLRVRSKVDRMQIKRGALSKACLGIELGIAPHWP